MSKAKLQKEISGFSREQLIEVILDAYSSSADAKKYFEFFLNPDAGKLREEKENIIAKELSRGKWGTCKARISVIKRALKEFQAFKGDEGNYAALCGNTLMMMLGQQQYLDYPEALFNGTAYVAVEYVKARTAAAGLDEALKNAESIINKMARPRMANIVRTAIKDYCDSLKNKIPETKTSEK